VQLNVCFGSDYRRNTSSVVVDTGSAPLGDNAISALWLLALALIVKMTATIFTFGIKVSKAGLLVLISLVQAILLTFINIVKHPIFSFQLFRFISFNWIDDLNSKFCAFTT
jgi:hypothetical protein